MEWKIGAREDESAKLWQEDANCLGKDPDIFFPDDEMDKIEKSKNIAIAKTICAACTARDDCLDYAMRNGQPGIWGGTEEHERRRLLPRGRKIFSGIYDN